VYVVRTVMMALLILKYLLKYDTMYNGNKQLY